MTEIRPFSAVRYNEHKVGDLAKVVCPPYDVITPEQQQAYYQQSDYNFIRIMLGKTTPEDDRKNNPYTRAKELYAQWLQDEVLIQDDKPGIYFYRQEYKVMGTKHSRQGFISLMKIEDDGAAKIFPHEKTHARAKEDRLKLWSALSSNLSPIFVCFSDRVKRVEKIFMNHVVHLSPVLNVVDDDDVKHLLWKLDDEAPIREIIQALDQQPLFIADGHHRYEVARQYRDNCRAKTAHFTGHEPFNYLMTYLTDIDSRDLQIFPMHRIVRKINLEQTFLEDFFRIDKVKTKEDLVILLAKAGKNEHAFGLYMKDSIRLLRLKNKTLIDKYVTEGSPEYRRLDATILKYFVFDRLSVPSEDIVYSHDLKRATREVDEGEAAASFIMNPVKIEQLKAIALNGERMPPKTTYFYPKVLSGLTVHKMA